MARNCQPIGSVVEPRVGFTAEVQALPLPGKPWGMTTGAIEQVVADREMNLPECLGDVRGVGQSGCDQLVTTRQQPVVGPGDHVVVDLQQVIGSGGESRDVQPELGSPAGGDGLPVVIAAEWLPVPVKYRDTTHLCVG